MFDKLLFLLKVFEVSKKGKNVTKFMADEQIIETNVAKIIFWTFVQTSGHFNKNIIHETQKDRIYEVAFWQY